MGDPAAGRSPPLSYRRAVNPMQVPGRLNG
jgi:hypothetical protein